MIVRSPADKVAGRPFPEDKSALSPFLSMQRMLLAVPNRLVTFGTWLALL